MKVHLLYEMAKVVKGNGVYTVFVQMVELLHKQGDIEVVVNRGGRGDIFHSHTYGFGYFLHGLGYRGRRILTVHVIPDSARGSIPGWQLFMPLIRWYFRQVYSYADVCIALSPMVEQVIRDLGAKTRIVRMYNPVPMDFWHFDEAKRKRGREILGLNDGDFVVLGVGQLEGRKGVEDFLDIAEAIPEARFVWAGGRPFGGLTEGLVRIQHRIHEAPANISFPGMFELEDMPLIYCAADLFVFPSYQENCPMAPLEAAACGLPVVFRELPEYKLLYEHPYQAATGTAEFVDMVRKFMEDSEFRSEGKRVSSQLLEQFDEDKIRSKLVSIYTELWQNSGNQ